MAHVVFSERLRGARFWSQPAAVRSAATLSLAAAYLHLVVTQAHFQEWWGYGVFFLAAAVGQASFAGLMLWRPRPWLPFAGIAGHAAIVGMYVLSRTNGVPLGPHAGRPESAGLLDLAATIAELGVIVALVALLPPHHARRTVTLLMLGGVVLWAGRLTGVLL